MFLDNAGSRTRRWRTSIDPYLGELSGELNIPEVPFGNKEKKVMYYNKETQKNADSTIENGFGHDFSFAPEQGKPVVTGVSDLVPQAKPDRTGYMEHEAAPERNAAQDARNKKLANIRAIAQGATLFTDILSNMNGGVVSGPLGGHEEFMGNLANIDVQYANQLRDHANRAFRVDAHNAGRDGQREQQDLMDIRAQVDRDYRSGEGDKDRAFKAEQAQKDRDLRGTQLKYSNRNAEYTYNRAVLDAQKMDDKRLQEAINAEQKDVANLYSELENTSSGDTEAKERIRKDIASTQGRINGMEIELANRAGYEQPTEPTSQRSYSPQDIPSLRGVPVETSGGTKTVGELLDIGVSPEDIANFLNQ